MFKNQLYIQYKWLSGQLWWLKKISWFQLILISRFLIFLLIWSFWTKIKIWGIFPTQFWSLNPILQLEMRNSNNSGIPWNLWNLSIYITSLGCFGQMGHFFHSKLSPGFESAIKIKKFQKLWNSQNSSGIL